MYRKHLARGVAKGAMTTEEADKKFSEWMESKANKIDLKIASLKDSLDSEQRSRLERESLVAHKRAKEIMAKNNPEPVAEETENPEAEAEDTAAGTESPVAETSTEATAENETPAEEAAPANE